MSHQIFFSLRKSLGSTTIPFTKFSFPGRGSEEPGFKSDSTVMPADSQNGPGKLAISNKIPHCHFHSQKNVQVGKGKARVVRSTSDSTKNQF